MKVKRKDGKITIVPKTELDMRGDSTTLEVNNSPHSLILRETGALTAEQQDLLKQIQRRESNVQNNLISDPSSPMSQFNPMIYV